MQPAPDILINVERKTRTYTIAIATVTEEVKTTARAIIKHEVFHSQSYQQMGATCSSLVEVTVNNRRLFGYIAKFFF